MEASEGFSPRLGVPKMLSGLCGSAVIMILLCSINK